ncbi:MAG: hypothetical protein K2W96_21100 [Gemmataceae bacterium]|nr:hypothetical protein [Gemmataceae bacterium]
MLFLTAHDPLGRSSGSIDPLGAMRCYGALADLLLPGVTTITWRSRYLSMLCAALRAGASRRQAVLPYERLWAVACVAVEEADPEATRLLRGVTFARDQWRRAGARIGAGFDFLRAQERTGGVGTYWSALAGAGLIDERGTLLPAGDRLGAAFPEPPFDLRRTAHRDDLRAWGQECHLGATGEREQALLRDALTDDATRLAVARVLRMMEVVPDRDSSALARLRRGLAEDAETVRLGLPVVADAIARAEAFHEAALALLDRALWWGTEHPEEPIAGLAALPETAATADRLRRQAEALVRFIPKCEQREAREALSSLAAFAGAARGDALEAVLQRHHQVQSGKADGGVPKRDWVARDGPRLRTAARFQRSEPPVVPDGKKLTHPYRLEPFAAMLRENSWFGDAP